MFFAYGEAELACLRARDKRLCEVIDKIGHVDRVVDTDLFSAVVHHIIGQQISTKAQATIWQRMQDALGTVNAETILAAGVPKLQALGMTFSQGGVHHRFCRARPQRCVRSGGHPAEKRRGRHPRIERPEGHRCLDGGDDFAVLYAASQHFQLRRPCHPARSADGLPPPQN